SRAAAAASPVAKTATRTSLPVPEGRPTVPRTIWSALRGSTPSRAASSTVSSNLALARLFTRSSASGALCSWSRSNRLTASLNFLPFAMCGSLGGQAPGRGPPRSRCGWCSLLDGDAHRPGRALDLLLGGVEVVGVQVGHLGLGDLFDLGGGDGAGLLPP